MRQERRGWCARAGIALGLGLGLGLLASCGGAPAKPATLSKTFTLHDEAGNQAGTLVLTPLGGGELRDSDGKVIGVLVAPQPATGAASPATADPSSAPASKE